MAIFQLQPVIKIDQFFLHILATFVYRQFTIVEWNFEVKRSTIQYQNMIKFRKFMEISSNFRAIKFIKKLDKLR
jgi:hypothetical protein